MYKSKSGPSTEPCEALYITISVRVSVIVIPRPTKLVRGINVTSDVRPPPVCISFPEQISETHMGVFRYCTDISLRGYTSAFWSIWTLTYLNSRPSALINCNMLDIWQLFISGATLGGWFVSYCTHTSLTLRECSAIWAL